MRTCDRYRLGFLSYELCTGAEGNGGQPVASFGSMISNSCASLRLSCRRHKFKFMLEHLIDFFFYI